ncbi:hypothetical protein K7X08_034012 [Anisodus acutangulus]|uniref:Uncharacterized protein n=1 Tax=Anisodus acutangulus TaxID=402998 RepID=A0A9Q1MIE1_9SOLA|nr:hypothetical protein K7X08_034012 [Anisodus acutangulus]
MQFQKLIAIRTLLELSRQPIEEKVYLKSAIPAPPKEPTFSCPEENRYERHHKSISPCHKLIQRIWLSFT